MGLDMYLYRAKKPALKMGIYSEDDDYISGLIQIPKEEITNPMYEELMPFVARIQVAEHRYDTEAISKDYKIGENVHPISFDSAAITFSGSNGTTPPIPKETIQSNYTKPVIQTRFVVDIQEVYYWRKAYNVQNLIHNETDRVIENCGFYRITEDVAQKIHNIDSDFSPSIVNDEEANIFYHEWY